MGSWPARGDDDGDDDGPAPADPRPSSPCRLRVLLPLTRIPFSLYRPCSLPQLALWVFSERGSGSPPLSRCSSLSSVWSTWSLLLATWPPWMRRTEPGRNDPGTSSPWPPTCPGESRWAMRFPSPSWEGPGSRLPNVLSSLLRRGLASGLMPCSLRS